MSFSSAIQPEINLFYGHYGPGTRTQQSFREIEWAMESNLLKCETHEMICVAETPESIVTLRAPSSGYGFTNATRESPSERGHGRENTFRTIDIVQEKTTLREGSSWRTVREREREDDAQGGCGVPSVGTFRYVPRTGTPCVSLIPAVRSDGASGGASLSIATWRCIWRRYPGREKRGAAAHFPPSSSGTWDPCDTGVLAVGLPQVVLRLQNGTKIKVFKFYSVQVSHTMLPNRSHGQIFLGFIFLSRNYNMCKESIILWIF